MMCHRIGLPPISTIGLGRTAVSSLRREPKPPARITAFIVVQVIERLVRSARQRRLSARCLGTKPELIEEGRLDRIYSPRGEAPGRWQRIPLLVEVHPVRWVEPLPPLL